ncbi:YhdP family protein [Billgrantia saliphila]|uniref:YhdP family phospholipid transporter n=1 Tax=Billgrantia saliphila TaxID=1848458 RepID=UPI000CE52D71|nr:AsmA-like C-terminal region-containing protein [Halomonas saliphila]
MHPLRLVARWSLTLLAVALALVAVLTLVLRLALTQTDELAPRVERLLEARSGAAVGLARLEARMVGLDPVLEGGGLTVTTHEGDSGLPLLEVEHARMRLDSAASLRAGMPVVADARLSGLTLHLYQDEQGGWHWPDPADLPAALIEGEFDLSQMDAMVGRLLRQRAWAEDVRLVLHGRTRRLDMMAPRLLLTGDERRAHLEGEVHLMGQEETTLQAALEVFPGPRGLRDFSAALQAEMKLDTLVDLVEVFTYGDPLQLEDASGDVTLWGRWHRGALADARLDIDVPRLALRRDDDPIVLEPFRARGQWLRGDEGWEAWLQGDASAANWAEPREMEDEEKPALPHFWHVRSDGEGWWLNTSQFELASLAAWRERVLLPEGLIRTIDALDPRGLVSGLGFGRRDGQWIAQAAVHRVEVSPLDDVPGGGPLDAWVEARDFTGRIEFIGVDDPVLKIPQVYAEPMALSHASGEVRWTYEGPRTFVSGRGLKAGWQGAEVEGGFGLAIGGGMRGGLGLDLSFRDVDAVDRPLTDWLPADVLGEQLDAWLAEGVAGRVPAGELKLHLPLQRDGESVPPRLRLDLAIEEGRLPFDPEWPALESLEGHLTAGVDTLEAEVRHAESLGVQGRNGRVTLADDVLRISGDVAADGEALRRYLHALPVDGMERVDDWRGEGNASGRLDLAMRLGEEKEQEQEQEQEDDFTLTLDTQVDLERLVYLPLDVSFRDVSGPLAWYQRDEEGGLEGYLEASLLGGPISADIDTLNGGVELEGSIKMARLLELGGADGLNARLSGRLPWRGRLTLSDGRNAFRFDSSLQGVAIDLPSPLGKAAGEPRPLWLEADLDRELVEAELGGDTRLRWRGLSYSDLGQGQLWLGRLPDAPTWPEREGWEATLYQSRLDLREWASMLSSLTGGDTGPPSGTEAVKRLRIEAACLVGPGDGCLGPMTAEARPRDDQGWRVNLGGGLLEGHFDYRPTLDDALDIALDRVTLDGLLPAQSEGAGELLEELDVPPDPTPLPDWVTELPNGRLRIADIFYQGRAIGPLTTRWESGSERLVLGPLGLTLGQISATGELVWESAGPDDSLTRSRLNLDGSDLGSALELLGQPVSIRSDETRVRSQLAWPGPPWQFALARSRGSIEAELRDGRFVQLESPTARLVGLLNVDNLLRRLRMDFSDVTGQGTAFDQVNGAATLYEGVLETSGPVRIDGPATTFTLDGTVDLARRELDQHLSVTVPVSSNLPLAAVIAGAPVVGGALFIADRLFGRVLDRATRIHYRVRGPWTSPEIKLETAE